MNVVSDSELWMMFVTREWRYCKECFQKGTKWYNFLWLGVESTGSYKKSDNNKLFDNIPDKSLLIFCIIYCR
jgi:hypothetical protein